MTKLRLKHWVRMDDSVRLCFLGPDPIQRAAIVEHYRELNDGSDHLTSVCDVWANVEALLLPLLCGAEIDGTQINDADLADQVRDVGILRGPDGNRVLEQITFRPAGGSEPAA